MRLTTAFLVLCCFVALDASALAKPLRLSGTSLTYQDRSTYKSEVQEAVRMWNAAGTGVKLRPAARGKAASVVFLTQPSLVHKGQRVAGLGGIHFTKKRKPYGRVQLSAAALGTPGQTSRGEIDIVAHELGHALGLPHNIRDRCSLMFPMGEFIRAMCPSSSDTFRCGPQQADAAALAKLYRRKLNFPAGGGLCSFPASWAEFVAPEDGSAVSGSMVRITVRNTSGTVWTDQSVALTFVDEAGQRAAGPCDEPMSMSPLEASIAPGEVASFDVMRCTEDPSRVFRVRMADSDTGTVFGPVRSYVG